MNWLRLFILLFFILPNNLMALEGKTFVYFINGDWFYQGPVFEQGQIRLKDQANIIYREMVEVAKRDSLNNYVLFYDPLGKGQIFNRKWVKLRIYKKGKKVFGLGLKHSEINANSRSFYKEFEAIIKKELGTIKREDALFYYYGEHFPAKGEVVLDLGSDDSLEDRGIGLEKVLELIKRIGPFDTLVFHTCYMNALDYIGPLLEIADQVVVPDKAIINTHQNWQMIYKSKDFIEFTNEFVKTNSFDKYQWLVYGKEVLVLKNLVEKLKANIAFDYWDSWLKKQKQNDFLGLRQRGDDLLFLSTLSQEEAPEIFVPLYDYINLINQYLLSGEDTLNQIDDTLEKFPHLENLYKELANP